MIYLDAAATTPVRREAIEAMWPFLTGAFGNPSSHHSLGEQAARALGAARDRVAASLGCRPGEVIFTSGGTEADNLAIKGIALASPRGRHIVTTAIEHEAVLASCDFLKRQHGFSLSFLPVDGQGLVHLEDLNAALRPDTTLCSIMLANNEVGTIQPIAELAGIARSQGIPFHTDAVQACGSLPLSVKELGIDAMSLSGHKFGAPKGVGALFLRGRVALEPVLHGGGQERGRRSGTENVAGAVAFATAMEFSTRELEGRAAQLSLLRDQLVAGVLSVAPNAFLTGHPGQRLPNNASFCFPGTSGESVLLQLEERGVLCSSGSACAAGSDEPSHVLIAMGIARTLAQTAVRFTLLGDTTSAQVDEVVQKLEQALHSLQAMSARS
ncbi:MAG: cysteine desulfurase family protein [Janthinobacterium lividum]